jgi:glycosyltransferase involved in cell wall biosynthesis
MKFSLVIPCYNEAKNISLLLNRCIDLGSVRDFELILVNNGSTDNTKDVLEQLLPGYPCCRVVNVAENKGYGYGILAGLKAAKGEILGWTHADMQTDPQDAMIGIQLFDKYGPEILVKGRRYGRPLADTAFTVGMSGFETLLLGKPMWDINAQPTMFSRRFYETWDSPPDDFSLDLYTYYKAKRLNLNVRRFPVKFGERAYGVSHWNVDWRSKWKFIQRTIEFSLKLRKRL